MQKKQTMGFHLITYDECTNLNQCYFEPLKTNIFRLYILSREKGVDLNYSGQSLYNNFMLFCNRNRSNEHVEFFLLPIIENIDKERKDNKSR